MSDLEFAGADVSDAGFHDQAWIVDRLRERGIEPFENGDFIPFDRMAECERWARLAGGRTGDYMTAALVNRGRLLDVMNGEAADV